MANIFRHEADIDMCNDALLRVLIEHAHSGEVVNLADLIARYAYDTAFRVSVGESPGFLRGTMNITAIKEALDQWKFRSVLSGSYMRFHPIIARLFRRLQTDNLEKLIISRLKEAADECQNNLSHKESGVADNESRSRLDAFLALLIVGADPTITHLLSSLYYIYSDTDLLTQVRDEINKARPSLPPKIKELLYAKPRMPRLHAALLESLRLSHPYYEGFKYSSPPEGCQIGGKYIAPDVSLPHAIRKFSIHARMPPTCVTVGASAASAISRSVARLPSRQAMLSNALNLSSAPYQPQILPHLQCHPHTCTVTDRIACEYSASFVSNLPLRMSIPMSSARAQNRSTHASGWETELTCSEIT